MAIWQDLASEKVGIIWLPAGYFTVTHFFRYFVLRREGTSLAQEHRHSARYSWCATQLSDGRVGAAGQVGASRLRVHEHLRKPVPGLSGRDHQTYRDGYD
jgi:hypothetical protein